jgi:hypothetical protein
MEKLSEITSEQLDMMLTSKEGEGLEFKEAGKNFHYHASGSNTAS